MANKNLYLFAGERYLVMKSLSGLTASLGLPLPEINITGFKTMPEAGALIEACAALPLMAEKRLVYVSDYTALTSDGNAEEAKSWRHTCRSCPGRRCSRFAARACRISGARLQALAEAGVVRESRRPNRPNAPRSRWSRPKSRARA
jgi:hypothetical protein